MCETKLQRRPFHPHSTHNTRESDSMENGEGVCQSLCCTAMWLSLRGDYTLAAVVLQHARERFPRDPLARAWMLCEAYIGSVRAMHRSHWDEAATACSQLYTFDRTVGQLQRAALRLRRGDPAGAERILLAVLADDGLQPLHRVRAWMLLAQCRDGMAAVNVLNTASVYAHHMYLAYEEALIDLHMAQLLLAMRMPKQALRTVRRCMNTILGDGGVYDVARMLFLFMRCLVAAEAGVAAAVAERLNECGDIVCDVLEKFTQVEATAKLKDVYVWLAMTYASIGQTAERNRWARRLRELERWSPTSPEFVNVFG